jgi:hypothetical protein
MTAWWAASSISAVSTIQFRQTVRFPYDAKHVHFCADFRPLTCWIFLCRRSATSAAIPGALSSKKFRSGLLTRNPDRRD